jgi:NADPH:quinone reductase-like Zn-dependent oxidoreductase
MKRYVIEQEFGIDELKLVESDTPQPGPGEVLVKMKAASLNYRDFLMVSGNYTRNLPLPLVPLSDGSGEVVAVGPGVRRWKEGDRVIGCFFQCWPAGKLTSEVPKTALGGAISGVLAEYTLFREGGLVSLPEHLSFEEGATLPCAGVTAWNCLYKAGLTSGDTVLTMGTGGVSLFALQFAKAAGARVIATTGSVTKEARLRELGASDVINYKSVPDWEKQVLKLTGGNGVNIVIEVGGAGTLLQSIKACAMGGNISLIGVLTGQRGEMNPLPAVMKGVSIHGIYVGSREMFEDMNRTIALHQIKPVVDRVFPFGEAREALHYLESGAHAGKVVIAIS